MDDFKSKFKAAAAARASSLPTKEQIQSLKAQRHAAADPGPTKLTKTINEQPSAQHQASVTLPSAFFQEAADEHDRSESTKTALGMSTSSIPAGFFFDKSKDLLARGEIIPSKQSIEKEFEEFEKSVDEGMKDIENKEAEEAKEEAEEREERELYEQISRLEQLEQLRQRKRPLAAEGGGEESLVAPIVLPPLKRNLNQKFMPEGEGEEEDVEEDELLDWRSKDAVRK